jgi:hypothetical protein
MQKATCWASNKILFSTMQNTDTNQKHNNYQAQKKRALLRKIEFVRMLGGKCAVCGYQKNLAALTFHHNDPNLKEFEFDRRVLSNFNSERLLLEIQKCTLLCSNCHAEHHNSDKEFWWVSSTSSRTKTSVRL